MIKTRLRPENPEANLRSYYDVYRGFAWSCATDLFPSYGAGLSNIVSESVDRWALDPKWADKTALIFEHAGEVQRLSYAELKDKSCRMANLLAQEGFCLGDTLLICSKPCPDVHVAVLACARIGVRFCNLGDCLTSERLNAAFHLVRPRGILIHTDMEYNLEELDPIGIETIFIAGQHENENSGYGIYLQEVLPGMESWFDTAKLPIDEPLYQTLIWESSGEFKQITHAHRDMLGAFVTGKYVLDLRPDSVLWTDADPSAVASVIYGILAPLLCGCATVIQGDTFHASTWYWTLERLGVSVWFTDSLKLKSLKADGDDLLRGYDFSGLRHVVTVGEPLTGELFQWVREKLNRSPHEAWMMDETGMICLANFASEQIKIGSIGKPVPGVHVAILDEHGETLPFLTLGQLALKPTFPCLALEISEENQDTVGRFRSGWFLTGDLALKDEDGYYYYFGRVDHLIRIGQLLTGAPEIEQIFLRHPEIKEVGVISKKSSEGSESSLKAFVKLKNSHEPSPDFARELMEFVLANMKTMIPNLEIEIVKDFPVLSSRRLLRRVLLARELGLPVGDITRLRE